MKTINQPMYRVINEIGEWVSSKTEEEALRDLPMMNPKYQWRVESYVPSDDEIKNDN
jgi:hypothetical protein